MLTVGLITGRPEPRLEWFFQSLSLNNHIDLVSQIIICDYFAEACHGWTERDVAASRNHVLDVAGKFAPIVQHVPPKPNVWAGKYRLTPRNWWHASAARNTILCYCRNQFIAYLDDRCVLMPTWMDAVEEAYRKNYAVCGTYSKMSGMMVKNGVIVEPGTVMGTDPRISAGEDPMRRRPCVGDWMFGCTFALPTEWMLQVNGVDESWDSVGMEDTHFGKMLQNNGYPIFHDGRMKMIEDRTPAEKDPRNREHDMKRDSKEKHPHDKNDKTHKLIEKLWNNKRAAHAWDLRLIRSRVLRGEKFPIPLQPTHDFFDGQSLASMT